MCFCRYAQSCWEEEMGGSEALSRERMTTAFKELIMRCAAAERKSIK